MALLFAAGGGAFAGSLAAFSANDSARPVADGLGIVLSATAGSRSGGEFSRTSVLRNAAAASEDASGGCTEASMSAVGGEGVSGSFGAGGCRSGRGFVAVFAGRALGGAKAIGSAPGLVQTK